MGRILTLPYSPFELRKQCRTPAQRTEFSQKLNPFFKTSKTIFFDKGNHKRKGKEEKKRKRKKEKKKKRGKEGEKKIAGGENLLKIAP